MSRPEHVAPPEIFYNEAEAKKYAQNTRMIEIQSRMSERAIELLELNPDRASYILDIGCGSGLSGEVLSEKGHYWVGVDISSSMLGVAASREVDGDLVESDMGHGMMFRPGTFDGAISISALQWLCNADHKDHVPQRRFKKFFQSLFQCLSRGARAVLQVYPETPQQMTLMTTAAMRCGFSGGMVIDYPNSTKAKKYYLCLFAGQADKVKLPKALTEADEKLEDVRAASGPLGAESPAARTTVLFSSANKETIRDKPRHKMKGVKTRDWIQQKKDRARKQGKGAASDSKYTARRRNHRF